ncbi:MAG: hypothetical protein WB994_22255 [Candidatus Acidiferrum sp.]
MLAKNWGRFSSAALMLTAVLGFGLPSAAQEASRDQAPPPGQERPVLSQDKIGAPEEQLERAADGKRHGMPLETYGVAPGTRFLVALEDELGTKGTAEKAKFKVKTLEPLEAGSGIYLPSGAIIEGHVSQVEPAGVAGRARLWITFDEIHTDFGRLPIVAEVVSVPGDHSVKNKADKEGLIEGRSSTQEDAAQAAAAGAALGAVKGVRDKDKKEAAEGAALGAITSYLMVTGRGARVGSAEGREAGTGASIVSREGIERAVLRRSACKKRLAPKQGRSAKQECGKSLSNAGEEPARPGGCAGSSIWARTERRRRSRRRSEVE